MKDFIACSFHCAHDSKFWILNLYFTQIYNKKLQYNSNSHTNTAAVQLTMAVIHSPANLLGTSVHLLIYAIIQSTNHVAIDYKIMQIQIKCFS